MFHFVTHLLSLLSLSLVPPIFSLFQYILIHFSPFSFTFHPSLLFPHITFSSSLPPSIRPSYPLSFPFLSRPNIAFAFFPFPFFLVFPFSRPSCHDEAGRNICFMLSPIDQSRENGGAVMLI